MTNPPDETAGSAPPVDGSPPAPPATPASPRPRRLTRSRRERMISGVAGGLAEYFDVDPVLVRAAFVVLAIVTGGIFVLGYIAAIIIMPQRERAPGEGPAGEPRASSSTGAIVLGAVLIVAGAVALARALDIPAPPRRSRSSGSRSSWRPATASTAACWSWRCCSWAR